MQQSKVFQWRFIPITILFGLYPFIMRYICFEVNAIFSNSLLNPTQEDWYFYYKSLIFVLISLSMLIAFILLKNKLDFDKSLLTKSTLILALSFAVFTTLSTYLSPYQEHALVGGPTRFEGLGVIMCYMVVLIYSLVVYQKQSDFNYLIFPFAWLVAAQAFIGLTQYMGRSFIQWKGIRDLIQPGYYDSIFYTESFLDTLFPRTIPGWTGTLGNSNYSGSFAALAVPFFTVLILFSTSYKKKWASFVITFLACIIALACGSEAGLLGISVSLILLLIGLSRYLPTLFSHLFIYAKKHLFTICVTSAVFVGTLVGITLLPDFIEKPKTESYLDQVSTPIALHHNISKSQIDNFILLPYEVQLVTSSDLLKVQLEDEQLVFKNQHNQPIQSEDLGSKSYVLTSTPFAGLRFDLTQDTSGAPVIIFSMYDSAKCGFKFDPSGVPIITNFWNFNPANIETPASIGFEGYEFIGSSRGYIWSRSLPLLKDTLLLGYGPDMFQVAFPQEDFWGKMHFMGSPFQGVDKPHNTYLQIWINQGFPAFLAFVGICGIYLIQCLKLYGFKKTYSASSGLGLAFMAAVIGYLVASFFNDTCISVTPLFYALLGAGMAYNRIYKLNSNHSIDS